jgi:large subunit ribosomal protein L9
MDIILLKKVEGLGNLGDKVRVRPGYGRNFLIPQGKATAATADNVARFEARRAELERQAAEALAHAEARRAQLEGLAISITARAGEEGRLFGSVGAADIVEAYQGAGVELHKNEVRLPAGPFRTLGEQTLDLHLHSDVNVQVTITIVAE